MSDINMEAEGARPHMPKPTRALKPDAQAFDRIVIDTVPRYKESELSGDEWRISAQITLYRKGEVIATRPARDVDTATRFVSSFVLEQMDEGDGFYAGEREVCDQEGCHNPARWRHELKHKYSLDGHKGDVMSGGEYRLFCDEHKRRGDCGLEDADRNYSVTPFAPESLND